MTAIQPESLWQYLNEGRTLIDVRSPKEYAQGHIPSARNMPLFDDDERASVGTTYKQVSPEAALIKGLEYAGVKMADFVRQAAEWSPQRKVVVHCWRGGKRSGSVAWLLQLAGFNVVTLAGGYKQYRQFVLDELATRQYNFVVLGGKTGSGKTFILKALERLGEQFLDLENMAHHKGSAFGSIGEKPQPTNEQFENNIYQQLRGYHPDRRIWLENESRSIGTVFIPQGLWQQKITAPLIHLEVPFDDRIRHLVAGYTHTSPADLVAAFERIKKKLGFDNAQKAIEAVEKRDFHSAAAIALTYYDKTYLYAFQKNDNCVKHIIDVKSMDFEKTARQLIAFVESDAFKSTQRVC